MASETLTPDGNTRNIAGAVTDDSNAFIKKLRIDDTTKGLKVLVVGGISNNLIVGTSTITSGTNTYIEYNNNGVLGEYSLTGTGTVVAMATSPTFQTSINGAYLTASELLITDSSSNIISATTATYPSLTELSYVKGVTSAIQTQINAKGAGTVTAIGVTTANGVSGSSSGGVTPALTITLGAITPSSVNGVTISGSSIPTLAVTGTSSISGSNTGDQNLSGYALVGQTMYIGKTSVAINRASAALALSGITSITGNTTLQLLSTAQPGATSNGYELDLQAGNGGATSGDGGQINIYGGSASAGNGSGGSIILQGGQKNGIGSDGYVHIVDATSANGAILNTSLLTADKTFTFPNTTGTLALTNATTLSSLTSVGTITTGGLGTGATIGGVTMNLGSDAVGDIYYAGASEKLTRLGIGTAGQVLTVNAGATAPAWQTPKTNNVAIYDTTLTVAYTNTTTTPSDMGVSVSITTVGGNILVNCSVPFYTSGGISEVQLLIDNGGNVDFLDTISTTLVGLSGWHLFTGVSAGAHTIKLQGVSTAGHTMTVPAYNTITLMAQEI